MVRVGSAARVALLALVGVLGVAGACGSVAAADTDADAVVVAVAATKPPVQVPAPPKMTVASHFLVDFSTDTVLAAGNADEEVEPASLTKLMTAYVVFEALEAGVIGIDDLALVSTKAWKTGGTRMFIDVNSHVKVADLIRGMLIQSGNDAATALAEHVSGSVEEFVALMNERAQALGMKSSVFRNPTGLPARGHHSSARDMAILAKAIIARFPKFYGIYAERGFSYNGIAQNNRNKLLWRDPSVDGMKTGYTDGAGYCIVSSAMRDGMRLIAVVMGGKTPKARNDAAQALIDYGFANYETHRLYAAGSSLSTARVWGGNPEVAQLGLDRDLFVTIPRGHYDQLAASMNVTTQIVAPVAQGAKVGELKVSFGDSAISTLPLVALNSVVPGGVWTKVMDEISLWLE
jgi:D-alanyl-D-alanine carboxypeptidase (penicillin-binding protein 5/6)